MCFAKRNSDGKFTLYISTHRVMNEHLSSFQKKKCYTLVSCLENILCLKEPVHPNPNKQVTVAQLVRLGFVNPDNICQM